MNANPNYADDQTLIAEIRALKKEGLKVMLGPQLCCATLSMQKRSSVWWDTHFSETTKFLIHFAKRVENADVDALRYAVSRDDVLPDGGERWHKIFREVRRHFSGEVGEMLWNLGSKPGAIIPDADFITWGKELDYFYIAIDTPISHRDNPTDENLRQGAATMLEGTNPLYERHGKPVFTRATYFNVKKRGWGMRTTAFRRCRG